MARNWWHRLPADQRREYERSATIAFIAIKPGADLGAAVESIRTALEADDRLATERGAQVLVARICSRLSLPQVVVQVSGMRPHDARGELHGIYTPTPGEARDRITVWMRTARRREVVAIRTFLRTLLHEVCHHVDMFALDLPSSFHTPGFYRRESSLFRAVVKGTSLAANERRARGARVADPEEEAATAAREVAAAAQALGVDGGEAAAAGAAMTGIDLLRATAAAIAARQRRDQ